MFNPCNPCCGGAGDGVKGCYYDIRAILDWSGDEDLNLCGAAGSSATCYYGNMTAGGLTLDRNAHPGGAESPPAPETISGQFVKSQTYYFWYARAGSTVPSNARIVVTNLGTTTLSVNGIQVLPGQSWIVDGPALGGPDPLAPTETTAVEVLCNFVDCLCTEGIDTLHVTFWVERGCYNPETGLTDYVACPLQVTFELPLTGPGSWQGDGGFVLTVPDVGDYYFHGLQLSCNSGTYEMEGLYYVGEENPEFPHRFYSVTSEGLPGRREPDSCVPFSLTFLLDHSGFDPVDPVTFGGLIDYTAWGCGPCDVPQPPADLPYFDLRLFAMVTE